MKRIPYSKLLNISLGTYNINPIPCLCEKYPILFWYIALSNIIMYPHWTFNVLTFQQSLTFCVISVWLRFTVELGFHLSASENAFIVPVPAYRITDECIIWHQNYLSNALCVSYSIKGKYRIWYPCHSKGKLGFRHISNSNFLSWIMWNKQKFLWNYPSNIWE